MENINFDELKKAIQKVKIKSFIITRDGKMIFEYYKNNKIRRNAQKINSCTKSIVSILIGIAIDKGYIKSIKEPVSSYFPELINEQADTRKRNINIEHLLTMSAGFDWPEFGEWNYFAPMVFSSNIVKYVFDRDLVGDPGERMNYNSGCSHVLTAILQKATGMKAIEFASTYLFKPLGISEFNWFEDNNGIIRGADGLRLTTTDMIKVGQLYMNNGVWNNRQIVSSEWIEQSIRPYYMTYEHIGQYAYHWWVRQDNQIVFGLGYGGQYICMIPKDNMVIAITSEIYEDSIKPLNIIEEYILSS